MREELLSQIKVVIDLHDAVEKAWLSHLSESNTKLLNMNSIKVIRAQSDISIISYIVRYIFHISANSSYIGAILSENGIDRVRVKEFASITQKLKKYIMGSQHGEMKFHKCLNDLLGVRIVLDDYDPEELLEFLKHEFPSPIIVMSADKQVGYRAIHLYTGAVLGHFKWEVQIWRKSDYDNNIHLHESYKRDYIEELKIVGQAEERSDSK